MTAKNFDDCFKKLVVHEGGFTDDPRDPGNKRGDGHGNQGSTNHGVTAKAWADYTGKPAPIELMKALTIEDVKQMYRDMYWDAVRADDLPSGLDWSAFDWCVNSGPRPVSKAIQRCVGATADGAIGPKTLATVVEHGDPRKIIHYVFEVRQRYYESLKTFEIYGKGWTRRNKETLEQAEKMLEE